MWLRGSFVALVTPFKGGRVDEEALRVLVERQIAGGSAGLVPCGTTGEAATLAPAERDTVLRTVVDQAAGRVPVIAGTGCNDTAATVRLTRRARELGADAALVVVPYYNKPTQEGLFRHFRHIAEETGAPLVLYDVPSRTGTTLAPETTARLVELDAVIAVKEASGDLTKVSTLIARCRDAGDGDGVPAVLSGDDPLTLPILAVGGQGVISVTANVVPAEIARMVACALEGAWDEARELHFELLALHRALFLETNPIPVKTALAAMGLIEPDLRLPLCDMADAHREELLDVLAGYHLIG